MRIQCPWSWEKCNGLPAVGQAAYGMSTFYLTIPSGKVLYRLDAKFVFLDIFNSFDHGPGSGNRRGVRNMEIQCGPADSYNFV